MGVVALFPRILAVMSKRREAGMQVEISRFESILKAQDKLLTGSREECVALERELAKERRGRSEDRQNYMEQISRLHREVYECRGMLKRSGWKDPRQERRGGDGQ